MLVHAYKGQSRVDYCNAILVVVSDGVIRKLQSVLHTTACLVTGVRWNEHITPTLRDTLHWLPVRHRITYKIATKAFRCVRGAFPAHTSLTFIPVGTVAGRAKLHSARHGELIVSALLPPPFGTVFLIISVKVTFISNYRLYCCVCTCNSSHS